MKITRQNKTKTLQRKEGTKKRIYECPETYFKKINEIKEQDKLVVLLFQQQKKCLT